MEVDITKFLGATTRRITTKSHEGRDARVLTATRSYATSPEDLWDAMTSPTRIPNWFLPISGDLKLGGRFQFEGNAGGEIQACQPPKKLEVTWEFGGDVSWVHLTLEPGAGETILTLEHTACVPDEMWNQYGPGAVGIGWESGLLGLSQHIDTGATMVAAEGMAWMGTENGKAFIRACSDLWADASIEAGTAEAPAREAAERTTAAYSGQPTEERE